MSDDGREAIKNCVYAREDEKFLCRYFFAFFNQAKKKCAKKKFGEIYLDRKGKGKIKS